MGSRSLASTHSFDANSTEPTRSISTEIYVSRLARRIWMARIVGVALLAVLLAFVGVLLLPFTGDARSVLFAAGARLTSVAEGFLP